MADFNNYKSIKTRAVISLVVIVSVVLSLFELYNYKTNERTAIQDLESLSERVVSRLAENLILPLWEIDNDWASSALSTEMLDKQIYAIFVAGDGGVFAGKKRGSNWQVIDAEKVEAGDYILKNKDVMHKGEKIGHIRLYITQKFVKVKLQNEAYKTVLITLSIIISISVFLVMMLDSIIIGPITRLLKIVKSVSKGEYSNYIEFTRDDEIGLLGKEFNDMQDNLMLREDERDNAVRELTRKSKILTSTNDTLEDYQDHLENKVELRTKELEKARDLAMEATKTKSLFLANMSHELRTPMNSIIGFTARVIKKASDKLSERELRNLKTVERNANHLLELINSLLDISKIEAGKMEAHAESFELSILVKEVFNITQPLLQNKSVEFKADLPFAGVMLYTDSTKLKQVLINLVTNAVTFTHEGNITISAHLLNDDKANTPTEIVISIIDTGLGMNKDDLDYIFEAFRQVDGDLNRKVGGTGLGLAIVSSFTELLGGKVDVESEENVGTTFKVTIPVNLYDRDNNISIVGKPLMFNHADNDDRHSILCIDDDDDVLELLNEYLSDENYDVLTANTAEQGLEIAKHIKPFAITLDILMPQKDGWSVLNELKADSKTCNIPVIIVSFMEDRTKGYQLGAYDYMQKPIRQERLIGSIERLSQNNVKKVLIVDDNAESRDLLQQILDDVNVACSLAVDGKDALSVLERSASELPDLILLDLMMPEMDGFEMLKQMQENPDWVNIPVIVVTAKTLEEHEREFLQPRVARILEKEGLSSEKVLEQMSKAMQRFGNISS